MLTLFDQETVANMDLEKKYNVEASPVGAFLFDTSLKMIYYTYM